MARPKKIAAGSNPDTGDTAGSAETTAGDTAGSAKTTAGNAHRATRRKSIQTVVRNLGGRMELMRQEIRDLERRLG